MHFSTYGFVILTPWSRVLLEKLTGFAANQQILHILWSPEVHYRIHKRPPPVPILSQLHPVPTTPSHFLKIRLNIILPSTSWSPQWSLSLRFPPPKPCAHLSLPPYVPHAPPISFFSILSPAQYWVRSTENCYYYYYYYCCHRGDCCCYLVLFALTCYFILRMLFTPEIDRLLI